MSRHLQLQSLQQRYMCMIRGVPRLCWYSLFPSSLSFPPSTSPVPSSSLPSPSLPPLSSSPLSSLFPSPLSLLSLPLQIAFAAADSVTGLKLIEAGLPKEKIAMMALPMVPLQIILPWIIRSVVAGQWSGGILSVNSGR